MLVHKVIVGLAYDLRLFRSHQQFEAPVARQIDAFYIFQPDQVGDGVDEGAQEYLVHFELFIQHARCHGLGQVMFAHQADHASRASTTAR